ncbi:MAG: metallophosphoesterase family protein [Streptosporangiaceae bacterium]
MSDFHASDPAWRKLLNAIRLNVCKADAVLYAGDLTGKAMVPIMAAGDRYEATLLGQRRVARNENELAALERDVAGLGYYAFRTTKEEVDALGGDQAKLDELFSTEIRGRVRQWLDLAAERLEGSGVPLVLIPGNDDPYDIDESLAASQYCVNADGAVVDIPGNLQVIGLGKSSPTPWKTPREVSEDAFREEIYSLADRAADPRRTIFLIHCPPYGSGLDTAPVLDENLRLQASAGDLMRGPVGSTGVLEAVQRVRPLLSLHGHIHESGGEKKIGQTLCVNPGSEAGSGIVRGYLIDVGSDGIERSFRVEG